MEEGRCGKIRSGNEPRNFLTVLVATAGAVDDDHLIFGERWREFEGLRERVGGLQRGEDSFEAGDHLEGVEGLTVGDADVAHAAGILPVTVLWADAGIIEPRADG